MRFIPLILKGIPGNRPYSSLFIPDNFARDFKSKKEIFREHMDFGDVHLILIFGTIDRKALKRAVC